VDTKRIGPDQSDTTSTTESTSETEPAPDEVGVGGDADPHFEPL
jgi:hypothetical protein